MASSVKPLMCAALLCLYFFGTASKARSPTDVLSARIEFDERAGSYYVDMTSLSSRFLCVGDYVFDTERAYISLVSKDGEQVAKYSHMDPGPPLLYRGVDLSKGYLFLKPGESRQVFINMKNFVAKPGIYNYKISFPYYSCADIISTKGSVASRQVPVHIADSSGTVFIRPPS